MCPSRNKSTDTRRSLPKNKNIFLKKVLKGVFDRLWWARSRGTGDAKSARNYEIKATKQILLCNATKKYPMIWKRVPNTGNRVYYLLSTKAVREMERWFPAFLTLLSKDVLHLTVAHGRRLLRCRYLAGGNVAGHCRLTRERSAPTVGQFYNAFACMCQPIFIPWHGKSSECSEAYASRGPWRTWPRGSSRRPRQCWSTRTLKNVWIVKRAIYFRSFPPSLPCTVRISSSTKCMPSVLLLVFLPNNQFRISHLRSASHLISRPSQWTSPGGSPAPTACRRAGLCSNFPLFTTF